GISAPHARAPVAPILHRAPTSQIAPSRKPLAIVAAAAAGLLLKDRLKRARKWLGPGRGNGRRKPQQRRPATNELARYLAMGDTGFREKTRMTETVFRQFVRDIEHELKRPMRNRIKQQPKATETLRGQPRKLSNEEAVLLWLVWMTTGRFLKDLARDF